MALPLHTAQAVGRDREWSQCRWVKTFAGSPRNSPSTVGAVCTPGRERHDHYRAGEDMRHLSKIALVKRDYFFLENTAPRCVRCGILSMTRICTYCQIDIDEGLEWPWMGKLHASKIVSATSRGGSRRANRKIGHGNRRGMPSALSGKGSSPGISRHQRGKNRAPRRRRAG